MKTYDDFLTEYESHIEWAVDYFKPMGDSNLQLGTVRRAKSFWEDFNEKLKGFEAEIVNKGNRLLQESETGNLIDRNKLRDEFLIIGNTGVSGFISTHKPK